MKYLIYITIILLFSCKVFKQSDSKTKASINVATNDSGAVKKSNNASNSELEWTKLVLQYAQPQKRGDTNVYNNYYAMPKLQPSTVIYETGKGKTATNSNTYDSSWDKKFSQVMLAITELSKQNKTTVLSFGQIIGLVAGAVVLLFILIKISSIFTIKNIIP